MPEAIKDGQRSYSSTADGLLTDSSEDTTEGLGLQERSNRRWSQRGVQAEQVSDETRNVGGSHGGSRDGIGSTVLPGGGDVDT